MHLNRPVQRPPVACSYSSLVTDKIKKLVGYARRDHLERQLNGALVVLKILLDLGNAAFGLVKAHLKNAFEDALLDTVSEANSTEFGQHLLQFQYIPFAVFQSPIEATNQVDMPFFLSILNRYTKVGNTEQAIDVIDQVGQNAEVGVQIVQCLVDDVGISDECR